MDGKRNRDSKISIRTLIYDTAKAVWKEQDKKQTWLEYVESHTPEIQTLIKIGEQEKRGEI